MVLYFFVDPISFLGPEKEWIEKEIIESKSHWGIDFLDFAFIRPDNNDHTRIFDQKAYILILKTISSTFNARAFTPKFQCRKFYIASHFFDIEENQRRRIINHEIGHIMGLRHSDDRNNDVEMISKNVKGIMLIDANTKKLLPTEEDVKDLRRLYNELYEEYTPTDDLVHKYNFYKNTRYYLIQFKELKNYVRIINDDLLFVLEVPYSQEWEDKGFKIITENDIKESIDGQIF
jgi:hypothetical protein